MDRAELGFNAWVLVPNALNTLLHGVPAHVAAAAGLQRDHLLALHALLLGAAPSEILDALEQMSTPDRELLLRACQAVLQHTGIEAEAPLGLPADAVAEVIRFLAAD